MNIKFKLLTLLILSLLSLSACSTWRKLDRTEKGAVIGGGAGAVIGDVVAPGVGGTLIGGAVGAVGGGLIGREQDRDKRNKN